MLIALHIRNLVTIEELALEVDAGMTTLTGETGAGKSILIDALGLVLGDKAEASLVRHGEEKAEITAIFKLAKNSLAYRWLHDHELDDNDECLLRRVVSVKGRSRAFINDTPVNLATLGKLGEQLVDIHGQHAHQSLQHRSHQRHLLDAYAGIRDDVDQLNQTWQAWKQVTQQYETLLKQENERISRLELLRFQVGEMEDMDLTEGEWAALETEQRRLGNADELHANHAKIVQLLDSEDGAANLLQSALNLLEASNQLDPVPADSLAMLRSSLIDIQEATSAIQQYADGLDIDPARLNVVEQRMSTLLQLARKHHIEPAQLKNHLLEVNQQLSQLEGAEEHLETLQQEAQLLHETWLQQAQSISAHRDKAAAKLARTVTASLQQLSMLDGRFSIKLHVTESDAPTQHGIETVEFLVSANPGQPQQPLSKAASGGELSRISLAIQVATIGLSDIPTLIFDEVDVGIGGAVAEVVGQLLRQLGDKRQVLCVTHLPQVASQAHYHLRVEKSAQKNRTRTSIINLLADQRIEEIARMLGGIDMTKTTLDHAREMLQKSA